MLMHRSTQAECRKENEGLLQKHNTLFAETFVPLSQRLQAQDIILAGCLQKMKADMPNQDFEKYIDSILSLKLINNALWLVTDSAMHRSLLEHKFVPAFKHAFSVSDVRILSQI